MSEKTVRLGDRVSKNRAQLFVGRREELAHFEALCGTQNEMRLLFVSGLAGIGKTMFAKECRRRAQLQGHQVSYLDAATLPTTPAKLAPILLGSLTHNAQKAGASQPSSPSSSPSSSVPPTGTSTKTVWILDSFEHLASLEGWLFGSILAAAPASHRFLLTGRKPPESQLLTDPGWSSVSRHVKMKALSRDETLEYLERCGVASHRRKEAYEVTHGHPLTLALIRQLLDRSPEALLPLGTSPKIVRTLLQQFVQDVPTVANQQALWVASMVRHTNQSLLRAVVDEKHSVSLLDWVAEMPFVSSTPKGLKLHELVSSVLRADLIWRDPQLYQEILASLIDHYLQLLEKARGDHRGRLIDDLAFVASHAGSPSQKIYEQNVGPTLVPEAAQEEDWPLMADLVEKHEGHRSARLLLHWKEKPHQAQVFRTPDKELLGFILLLDLGQITPNVASHDPAVGPLYTNLKKEGRLSSQRPTLFCRFWMCQNTYQAPSPCQASLFLYLIRFVLDASTPTHVFAVHRDPEMWIPLTQYAEIEHWKTYDFQEENRSFGIFGHDFGVERPERWLHRSVRSFFQGGSQPKTTSTFGRSAFDKAIKSVLKGFDRPEKLRNNPLLTAPFLGGDCPDRDDLSKRIDLLKNLVYQRASTLKEPGRDRVLFDVLERTYFKPAVKQRVVAEELGLSYGTYRRYLSQAVQTLSDRLWHQAEPLL